MRTIRRSAASQRGLSTIELLVVLLVVSLAAVATLPNLKAAFQRFEMDAASNSVRSMIEEARIGSLKQKVPYRILINDNSLEDTIELQREEGGSFVTATARTYTMPRFIGVLNRSPTDSIDRVVINAQGRCDAGKVYLGADDGELVVISIAPTCIVSVD